MIFDLLLSIDLVGTHRLVLAVLVLVAIESHAETTHSEKKNSTHQVGQHLQNDLAVHRN